jgi:signal transduction histidine kinase
MNDIQRDLNDVLAEVVQSLTANLDLSIVLMSILEALSKLIHFDSASIMLLEGDQLNPVANRSKFPAPGAPLTINIAELAHIKETISQRRPVRIDDTHTDSRWLRRAGNEAIRTWLGVPLVTNDIVIGLLNISHTQPRHFNDADVRIANAFAAFAAVALNNAALHHRLQTELAERQRAEAELHEERRRLAERVMEQTAALRAANHEMARIARMKNEFMAAMSHELRTPLNVIMSMTDLLREEAYGSVNRQQREALQRIDKGGKQLRSLINDVLDVARIESGSLHLEGRAIDVDALCRACLAQVDAAIKHQTITYTIEASLPQIVADELRLRQILLNMLSNAVKFTAEGGSIGLEVRRDDVHDCLSLSVWDTGIGIDAADLHRLFQPFVQLDGRLNRQYEGTGLGLTLIHRLTALHGGSLAIESHSGKGSRFTVRLPWIALINPSTPPRQTQNSHMEPERAVPAGTEAPLIQILTELEHTDDLLVRDLTAAGRRVAIILQGSDDVWMEEQPDLLVVTSHPPLQNTLETLQTIRSSSLRQNTPIIVAASLHLPGDREAILAAGAAGYAIKPLARQEFNRLFGVQTA